MSRSESPRRVRRLHQLRKRWGVGHGKIEISCGAAGACGADGRRGPSQLWLEWAAIEAVAAKLGVGTAETLRSWVRQVEVDAGARVGVRSEEHAEIKRLKRELAELRRANEILKAASVFFAAELDRPPQRW
jgi:transposase